jgi:broad specificity phosphatase PhoE
LTELPVGETSAAGDNRPIGGAATRVFLIRHGETVWNVDGRYQGQADPPLNPRGLRQARTLAHRLRWRGIEGLYASPLLRAKTTAQIVSTFLRAPLRLDARLMEIDLGRWQGRLATDIERDYPELFRRWKTEPWSVIPPGGESLVEVRNRVYAAVDDLLAQGHPLDQPGGRCLGIVTHRIPYLLLGMRYLGFPPDAIGAVKIGNGRFAEITAAGTGALPPDEPPGARRCGAAPGTKIH